VNKSNKLHAIKVVTNKALSDIEFEEEWVSIPLVVYSPEFGDYKSFLHRLGLVRKMNIRIFLSAHNAANYTALHILSSFQISCGLYFEDQPLNWELLNDLMQYEIYSRTRHAPIEPFNWLATHYEPTEYTDYNIIYFNSPAKYLHLNEKGKIALTAKDLSDKNFLSDSVESLDNLSIEEGSDEVVRKRYETMLKMNECAFCEAFRICLAKFEHLTDKKNNCMRFFADFLDAADYYYHARHNNNYPIWQL
jgi:hypothetical protein